jgi:hypothetical protein
MLKDYETFDQFYGSYDTAFVKPSSWSVRFENKKGWFEEAQLTKELAFWILMRGLVVVYE